MCGVLAMSTGPLCNLLLYRILHSAVHGLYLHGRYPRVMCTSPPPTMYRRTAMQYFVSSETGASSWDDPRKPKPITSKRMDVSGEGTKGPRGRAYLDMDAGTRGVESLFGRRLSMSVPV